VPQCATAYCSFARETYHLIDPTHGIHPIIFPEQCTFDQETHSHVSCESQHHHAVTEPADQTLDPDSCKFGLTCIWVYMCAHAYGSIRVLPIQATLCVKSTRIYFFLRVYGLHYNMTSSRSVSRDPTTGREDRRAISIADTPLQHAVTRCNTLQHTATRL